MSVQIIINGENAPEALRELGVLASGITAGVAVPAATITAAPAAAETNKRAAGSQRAAKQEPQPAPEEKIKPGPEPDNPPVDEPDGSGSDAGSVPTVVELRAVAQQVGKDAEGKAKVKALLDEFGSNSVTNVPEEKRAAFMSRLEGILSESIPF